MTRYPILIMENAIDFTRCIYQVGKLIYDDP